MPRDDARELRRGISREVWRLALPAIAHSLLQTLVFVVDRIMLGRHDATSLAALQAAGPLEWSVISVFSAFSIGTLARVGERVGARDPARARLAALASLALAFAAGMLVVAATPLCSSALPLFSRGSSPAALDEARGYLSIVLPASPFAFAAIAAVTTLQASGDTRTPLAVGVVGNLIHVALNAALIPSFGARGAAASTGFVFFLEAVLAILALTRPRPTVTLRGAPLRWADLASEFRALGRVAGPAVMERVLYHLGYLGFVSIIGRLGDTAMAANQVLLALESVCFLSADGFGVAAGALVAQKRGAGDPTAAACAARIAVRHAVGVLSACGLVAFLGRGLLVPVFSPDLGVVDVATAVVPILALAQPFMATGVVLGQALRGAGATRVVLAVSVVAGVLTRLTVSATLALAFDLGLIGVWLGSTTDWLLRTLLLPRAARRVFDAR